METRGERRTKGVERLLKNRLLVGREPIRLRICSNLVFNQGFKKNLHQTAMIYYENDDRDTFQKYLDKQHFLTLWGYEDFPNAFNSSKNNLIDEEWVFKSQELSDCTYQALCTNDNELIKDWHNTLIPALNDRVSDLIKNKWDNYTPLQKYNFSLLKIAAGASNLNCLVELYDEMNAYQRKTSDDGDADIDDPKSPTLVCLIMEIEGVDFLFKQAKKIPVVYGLLHSIKNCFEIEDFTISEDQKLDVIGQLESSEEE